MKCPYDVVERIVSHLQHEVSVPVFTIIGSSVHHKKLAFRRRRQQIRAPGGDSYCCPICMSTDLSADSDQSSFVKWMTKYQIVLDCPVWVIHLMRQEFAEAPCRALFKHADIYTHLVWAEWQSRCLSSIHHDPTTDAEKRWLRAHFHSLKKCYDVVMAGMWSNWAHFVYQYCAECVCVSHHTK